MASELTAKQQAVWDLQQEGKTHEEISKIIGIAKPVVNKYLSTCRKKLGITNGRQKAIERSLSENKNPDKFAAVFDAMSETRLSKLGESLEENGVSPGAAAGIIKRIKAKYYGAVIETRNLKTMELDEIIGKKIHLLLSYLDDKNVSEAGARDIAMAVSQLVEKQQLLRGMPTAITSDLERKKMLELTPLLIAEAQRRGITLEGQFREVKEVVDVTASAAT